MQERVGLKNTAAADAQGAVCAKDHRLQGIGMNRRIVKGHGSAAVHESFECPVYYVIGATIKIDRRAGRRVAAIDLKGRIGDDCSGAGDVEIKGGI